MDGTSNEERLNALARELRDGLDTHGIGYTSLAFKSHITLVKKPSRFITDIVAPSAKMFVERISVMESARGNGQLVYEEKYHSNATNHIKRRYTSRLSISTSRNKV